MCQLATLGPAQPAGPVQPVQLLHRVGELARPFQDVTGREDGREESHAASMPRAPSAVRGTAGRRSVRGTGRVAPRPEHLAGAPPGAPAVVGGHGAEPRLRRRWSRGHARRQETRHRLRPRSRTPHGPRRARRRPPSRRPPPGRPPSRSPPAARTARCRRPRRRSTRSRSPPARASARPTHDGDDGGDETAGDEADARTVGVGDPADERRARSAYRPRRPSCRGSSPGPAWRGPWPAGRSRWP